jgi:hypothetical protein
VLAFAFPRVRGTATFTGMLAGEAVILWTANYTDISWLWYNGIGCAVVLATALTISVVQDGLGALRPSMI